MKKSTNAYISMVMLQMTNTPRMHLSSIGFRNQHIEEEYKYEFTYNHYNLLPSDYLTLAVDHWGYYRGANSGPIATSVSNYYESRNPIPQFSQYGLLNRITYPTGGVTELFYEQNDFSKYQADNRLSMRDTVDAAYTGGVRVSMIAEYENENSITPIRQRWFSYTYPYSQRSSGQLFSKPKYWWPNWEAKTESGSATSHLTQFCTSAILPLSNSFGPHVGYSYVTETFSDGKRIVYNYSNVSDSQDEYMYPHFSLSCPTPYDMFSERGYKRGRLLSVSTYKVNELKKKTEYTYRTDYLEDNFVWSCNLGVANYGTSLSTQYYPGGIYKLFYPKYDVIKEKTTIYYDSGNIMDVKTYQKEDRQLTIGYGSYYHPVDVRITRADTLKRGTETVISTYLYPFESTGIDPQLTYSQFFLSPLLTDETLNNVTTKNRHIIYQSFQNKILPKYELERKNGIIDTLVTYIDYTDTGVVKKYREMGKPTIGLTWTNNDCLLSRVTIGDNIATQYTYTPFNQISSVTMPNGDVRYYTYDLMGRLIQIADKNGHVMQKFSYNYINN